MDVDRSAETQLLQNLNSRRAELATLLEECSSHWGFEDPIYRFYHTACVELHEPSSPRCVVQVHGRHFRGSSAASLPRYNRLVSSDRPALDVDTRSAMKRWLDTWKRVGPILEAERWERLRSMTDAEAQQASQLVLELWQPDWHGDDGEELVLHQRVFARARR